jgi:hypothetical protein
MVVVVSETVLLVRRVAAMFTMLVIMRVVMAMFVAAVIVIF